MPSRRERSSTPASVRVSTVRITPDRELPRRSSATTTTASPARVARGKHTGSPQAHRRAGSPGPRPVRQRGVDLGAGLLLRRLPRHHLPRPRHRRAGRPTGEPGMSEPDLPLPPGYPELLEELKNTVAAARWRAQRVVKQAAAPVLAPRAHHPGPPASRGLGHRGHQPARQRPASRLPRGARPVPAQPHLHADLRRGLSRRDHATACCAIALGSRHRATRQRRH